MPAVNDIERAKGWERMSGEIIKFAGTIATKNHGLGLKILHRKIERVNSTEQDLSLVN